MPSALGTSASRSSRVPYWYDIRDFGAIPGAANAATTRAAIQAAVDRLATRPATKPQATISIPANTSGWYIDGPVFVEQGFVRFQGEGPTSSITMTPGNDGSCFMIGMLRGP